jgi:hypothetical protein
MLTRRSIPNNPDTVACFISPRISSPQSSYSIPIYYHETFVERYKVSSLIPTKSSNRSLFSRKLRVSLRCWVCHFQVSFRFLDTRMFSLLCFFGLVAVTIAQKCPLQFDGRVPSSAALTSFDSSLSLFNPTYNLGASQFPFIPDKRVQSLVNKITDLKWSDVLLFPSVDASLVRPKTSRTSAKWQANK